MNESFWWSSSSSSRDDNEYVFATSLLRYIVAEVVIMVVVMLRWGEQVEVGNILLLSEALPTSDDFPFKKQNQQA